VQRFARIEDIDAAHPTVEEREEYEVPVRMGLVVYAGVDYSEVLRRAETEADVIVWDGGNNDLPFIRPDLMITVCDPLRPNDTLAYHPGEANVRRADVIVVNKVDSASPEQIAKVERAVRSVNEQAPIVRTASPVTLGAGPSLHGARVLVVEDGPSLTHGGLSFGAGTVAARQAGAASLVDPRPFAVGSIARTLDRFHHLATVLPAMGYGAEQLADLADTIRKTDCDVVVTGTPIDLARLIDIGHPHRHASYELRETGSPTLVEVLLPHVLRWGGKAPNP
jgi:predicted GTPase